MVSAAMVNAFHGEVPMLSCSFVPVNQVTEGQSLSASLELFSVPPWRAAVLYVHGSCGLGIWTTHAGAACLLHHVWVGRLGWLGLESSTGFFTHIWCGVRWVLWWLMTLMTFSYDYWPFLYLLWRNVRSSPLHIFNWAVCLFVTKYRWWLGFVG